MGGFLQHLVAAGVGLRLLAATDGEGSHPGSAVLTPTELAHRRVLETAHAPAALGVGSGMSTRLGPPAVMLAHVDRDVEVVFR